MLSKVVSSTIFKVFGMTRPGIEPMSPGPLANTLTAGPMSRCENDRKTKAGERKKCLAIIFIFAPLLIHPIYVVVFFNRLQKAVTWQIIGLFNLNKMSTYFKSILFSHISLSIFFLIFIYQQYIYIYIYTIKIAYMFSNNIYSSRPYIFF